MNSCPGGNAFEEGARGTLFLPRWNHAGRANMAYAEGPTASYIVFTQGLPLLKLVPAVGTRLAGLCASAVYAARLGFAQEFAANHGLPMSTQSF